jgi:hypothetical protein
MSKRYVYKNVNKRPINIGGYRFEEGQELESDILINGFNEAVSNGFLELTERKPEGAEPEATQSPQMGDTGKIKIIFHIGIDAEGKEILMERETIPNVLISFPDIDLGDESFEGWFLDAKFTNPAHVGKSKAKSSKSDIHFYGKYKTIKEDDTSQDQTQITLPSLPLPPPIEDKPTTGDASENK